MSNLIQKDVEASKSDDFKRFAQRSAYHLMEKIFNIKKAKVKFRDDVWRDINFKALGLNARAKLLLNPLDEGFSKEFYLYGFREPLNIDSIYTQLA